MSSYIEIEDLDERLELGLPDVHAAGVYCWRVEQLERAGYASAVAHSLASDEAVDLHLACDLIGSGCPQDTAYEILT